MGAGTIELDGDFKAEQMEVNVGAGTIENSGSLDIKEADLQSEWELPTSVKFRWKN